MLRSDDNEVAIVVKCWEDTIEINGITCEFDADIVIPDKTIFPVYKIEQNQFSSESISKVVDYFTEGSTGIRDTSTTKEELEQQLIIAKRGSLQPQIEPGSEPIWGPYEGQEEDIARLESEIAQTPQQEVFDAITDANITVPSMKTYEMPENKRLHIIADQNQLLISPLKYEIIQPESWIQLGDAYPGEPVGTTVQNIKISEFEAQQTVEDFLNKVNIENMGIAETEKARIIDNFTYEILSNGYNFTLARNDGDSIPVYNHSQQTAVLYSPAEEYSKRWYPELINIYVDEKGIQSFSWQDTIVVEEVLNDNVLILNFEDIKTQVLKGIEYGSAYATEKYPDWSDSQIMISEVVLTNVMIPIKDDPAFQMLAPAWIVYYEQDLGEDILSSFIAINAIDGSTIDMKIRN